MELLVGRVPGDQQLEILAKCGDLGFGHRHEAPILRPGVVEDVDDDGESIDNDGDGNVSSEGNRDDEGAGDCDEDTFIGGTASFI